MLVLLFGLFANCYYFLCRKSPRLFKLPHVWGMRRCAC
jgi:hypothetical protein